MSYSTVAHFAARLGPRLWAQLTAEPTTAAPDEAIAQAKLTEASLGYIDLRLATRYVVPVTHSGWRTRLAGIEEEIALWLLWVYRGIGEGESGAAAAKVGYDNAIAWLDKVAAGDLDMPGADERAEDTSGWTSNEVVYSPTFFRRF